MADLKQLRVEAKHLASAYTVDELNDIIDLQNDYRELREAAAGPAQDEVPQQAGTGRGKGRKKGKGGRGRKPALRPEPTPEDSILDGTEDDDE